MSGQDENRVVPNPDEIRAAKAGAVADNPGTADLLERHSRGERLTPREYGLLSAFSRKVGGLFRRDRADAEPAPAGNGGQTVGVLAPAQAPDGGLAAPEIDDLLCKRTATAILERADAFTVATVERHARDAGAVGETVDRFRRAASLGSNDKKLIVELSPDVCRELGIDPRQFAVWTVVGVLGLHGLNIWQCVQELKGMKAAKAEAAKSAAVEARADQSGPSRPVQAER